MTRQIATSRMTALLTTFIICFAIGFDENAHATEKPKPAEPLPSREVRDTVQADKAEGLAKDVAAKKSLRQRNLAELTALRDEMRGLREDVRRLCELQEKRLEAKALVPSAVDVKTEPSDKTTMTEVKNGMLFFTAAWCGPCQEMQRMIERLRREGLPIQIADIDRQARLAEQYQVLSIPCCVFIAGGKEVDRITGLTEEKGLRSRMKRQLAKQVDPSVKSLADLPRGLRLSQGETATLAFDQALFSVLPSQGDVVGVERLSPQEIRVSGKGAGDIWLDVWLGKSTTPERIRVQVIDDHLARGLNKLVDVNFENVPLSDALKKLFDQVGMNVVLDAQGLEEEGLKPSEPISIHVSGVSCRSALTLMLTRFNLAFVERNEVIWVTSRVRAQGEPTTVVYQVEDLLRLFKLDGEGDKVPATLSNSGEIQVQFAEQLVKLIAKTISPDSWDEVGGYGSIRYHELTHSLIIRQTYAVHTEIAQLLQQLRQKMLVSATKGQFEPMVAKTKQEIADLIWQQLGLRMEPLPEKEQPQLGPKYRGGMKVIEVKPDSPAATQGFQDDDILVGLDKWETTSFENVSFILAQPCTKDASGIRSLKFLVLRGGESRTGFFQLNSSQPGAKGKYTVDAKPNADPNALVVMTYAVGDLVVPLPPLMNADGRPKSPGVDAWLKLIDLIVESTDPQTWEENGGPSTIKTYETTLSLVIRAPQATHVKIAELLNQKRREQDVQLVFEMQVLHPGADFSFEKAGLKVSLDEKARVMKLDERDVAKFLEAIREQNVERLSAPKVTTFGGQIAEVQTNGRTAVGNNVDLHWYLRGVATPKRDEIRLNIALNPHHLVNELTSHTHRIPDGDYLLFDMTDEFHRNKSEKPKGRLLVLVRAKILIQKEEEDSLDTPVKDVASDATRPSAAVSPVATVAESDELAGRKEDGAKRSPLLRQIYRTHDVILPVADMLSGKPGSNISVEQSVIDQIIKTVEPESWVAKGGRCTASVFGTTQKMLLIDATPDMHKQIARLLGGMRADRNAQADLEGQLLQVADLSLLEKAGLKETFDLDTGVARLDESSAKKLLEVIEADQGVKDSQHKFHRKWLSIVSFNVRGADEELRPFMLQVRGQVTKNHQRARLDFQIRQPFSSATDPASQSHTLTVDDYLLLDLTDQNHLPKNEKPKGRVLVLVRSRVINPANPNEKSSFNDPKANGIDFSSVTPRGGVQKEEEELLGVPKEDQERREVAPE